MPSIEIVCIGQERPSKSRNLPFAVESGTALVSHRKPSLFQKDFDQLQGCIYHLGNPGLKNPDAPGAYFAWDLLSPECRAQAQETYLHFADQYVGDVRLLLQELLQASPRRRLLFTSDHQFGPSIPSWFAETSLEAFWKLHDAKKLRMNSLIPIAGSR